MFLHCNSEFSLIGLYYFFIIQVLHCQTMLISNYNLINTITYNHCTVFTPYQSPARVCNAALCTQNPRHEKTYIQGLTICN